MKIIEIKQTRQGEVAYLFDEARGKIYKVWVEDMTQSRYDRDEAADEPEDIDPGIRYEEPRRPQPRSTRVRVHTRTVPQDDNEGLEDIATPEPKLPIRPRPSMIPPALAGIFKPVGTPGAAEEVRRV